MRIYKGLIACCVLALLHGCGSKEEAIKVQSAAERNANVAKLDPQKIHDIGMQAYVYGYPMVLMYQTREVMTSVAIPQADGRAPVNQFAHASALATPEMTDVVRPNVDTLYSSAWLDLKSEPMMLSLPASKNRLFMATVYDMFTNNTAIIESQSLHDKPITLMIVGPHWNGQTPKHVKVIKSPGDDAWLLMRTRVLDARDIADARKFQAHYILKSLSQHGALALNRVAGHHEKKEKPMDRVASMSAAEFFTKLMREMVHNSIPVEDKATVDAMASIGLVPSESFEFNTLDPEVRSILERVPQEALKKITNHGNILGSNVNGWRVMTADIGVFATRYLDRAAIALIGLGALPAEMSMYPTTFVDVKGERLHGKNNYIIHFERNQLPPVRAFWSLTMYDAAGFLVSNALKRYSLGDRSKLHKNRDGSVDIYVQHDNPGRAKVAQWLPAPVGEFSITLRMALPEKSALTGEWKPPVVKKVSGNAGAAH